jgi:uncharacterized membrane protein
MSRVTENDPARKRYGSGFYGVIVIIVLGHALAILLSLTLVKAVLGLIVIGYIPGALLIRLLFQPSRKLTTFEGIVLSLVFSLVLCAGLGVLLNLFPGGLRPDRLNLALWGLVVLLCVLNLGFGRRLVGRAVTPEERPVSLFEQLKARLSAGDLVAYSVILLLAVTGLVLLVFYMLRAENGERFTEFYALSQEGIADSSLATLPAGDTSSFLLGIANRTGADQSYSVEAVTLEEVLFRTDGIAVPDGETASVPVSLQLPDGVAGTKLLAKLYLMGEANPLYVLHLGVAD